MGRLADRACSGSGACLWRRRGGCLAATGPAGEGPSPDRAGSACRSPGAGRPRCGVRGAGCGVRGAGCGVRDASAWPDPEREPQREPLDHPGRPGVFLLRLRSTTPVGAASTLTGVRGGVSMTGARVTLVGRDAVIGALDTALAECAEGGARIVLAEGATGCGKSALADAAAERARRAGALVLTAVASPEERHVALGVLRQLAHGEEGFALPLPVPAADGSGAPPARVEAMQAFCARLRELSAQRPVVLIVDDIQHADGASLQYLQYLARHARTAAVLTVLTGTPHAEDLDPVFTTELMRQPHFARLRLDRLTPTEVAKTLTPLRPTAGLARPGALPPSDRVVPTGGPIPTSGLRPTNGLLSSDELRPTGAPVPTHEVALTGTLLPSDRLTPPGGQAPACGLTPSDRLTPSGERMPSSGPVAAGGLVPTSGPTHGEFLPVGDLYRISGGNPLLLRALVEETGAGQSPAPEPGGPYGQAVATCLHRTGPTALAAARTAAVLGEQATPERVVRLLGGSAAGTRRALAALEASGLLVASAQPETSGRYAATGQYEASGLLAASGSPDASGRHEGQGRYQAPSRYEAARRYAGTGLPEASGGPEVSVLPEASWWTEASGRPEAAGHPDGVRFRHPAARAAVLEDTTPGIRADLHRRAARLLREDGAPATTVAEHLLAAATDHASSDPTDVEVLREAAEELLAQGGARAATRLLELALQADADAHTCHGIRLRLAQVAARFDPAAAERQLTALLATHRAEAPAHTPNDPNDPHATPLGDPGRPADIGVAGSTRDAGHAERLGRSDPAEPTGVDLVRNTEHARLLVGLLYSQGRVGEVPGLVPGGDRGSGSGSAFDSDLDTPRAVSERLLQGTRLADATATPLAQAVRSLTASDQPDRAVSWSRGLLEEAERAHAPGWVSLFGTLHAEALLRLGDLTGAHAHATAALQALPDRTGSAFHCAPTAVLIRAGSAMGRFTEASRLADRQLPPRLPASLHGLAYLRARGLHRLAVNQPHAALADFLEAGRLMAAWGIDRPAHLPWRTDAAEALLLLGEARQAEQLVLDQLAHPDARRPWVRGLSLRLRAHTGEPRRRTALLGQAVEELHRSGDRVETARAMADLGRALQSEGSSKGNTMVRNAWNLAKDSEAVALCREILPDAPLTPPVRDRAQAGGQTASGGAKLSGSEQRVATLAAQGLTNREISAKLFLTVSTVEQHLTRVYRKLRISSRGDLPMDLAPVSRTAL
ncbi:BREX system ATP-binding domain-containing protein [Streptomyces sp. NPDC127051]|uniref:BREX system ATP-binding domain-containing protein n=1 Tax=Streptomyces sp. NPDC127051 TaxID=3347119 RepID=UPI003665A659